MTSNINLLTNADANLILTGYTGPNQPAIGRALSQRLERRLVSFEERLEARTGMSPAEMREIYGKAHLKTLEGEVMDEVVLFRGTIIRVDGSVLAAGDHLARLAETGPIICLVSALDAVLRRLHLAMGARYHNPAERAVALGNLRRAWSARGAAGVYEVDATYLDEVGTVDAVAALWRELALQRG